MGGEVRYYKIFFICFRLKRDCLKRIGLSIFVTLLFLLLVVGQESCTKDGNMVAGSVSGLEASCDTLSFDTVFVSMGTATRQFKVYNRSHEGIRLTSVSLKNGRNSRFRINVDGDTSMVVHDVDIAAGDSIFVFVRANIDPNDETMPFMVEDAVVFGSGDAAFEVRLTAYGRNAVYHHPKYRVVNPDGTFPKDVFGNYYDYSVIDCSDWDHSRPHVILGYGMVPSGETLNLMAGDEIYFYNDAVLWVYDGASLNVQGTPDQPVVFSSVRHDGWYDFLPGQWGYIWLSKGSKDNYVSHALIENGYVGILADTNANGNPTLRVSNTVVRNHSLAGIIGQTAYIVGNNLLVHTCGTSALALQYGGRYDFTQCTFANYWNYSTRKGSCVVLNNHYTYDGVEYLFDMAMARFTNCIVYGSWSEGEMVIDLDERVLHDVMINHSIVRGGDWDEDPMFVNPSERDFHLKEGSPAEGIGYLF